MIVYQRITGQICAVPHGAGMLSRFGAYHAEQPVRTCRRVSVLRREQPHLRVAVLVSLAF
jgi:hypothetical protein